MQRIIERPILMLQFYTLSSNIFCIKNYLFIADLFRVSSILHNYKLIKSEFFVSIITWRVVIHHNSVQIEFEIKEHNDFAFRCQ